MPRTTNSPSQMSVDWGPLAEVLDTLADEQHQHRSVTFDFGAAGHLQLDINLDPSALAPAAKDGLLSFAAKLTNMTAKPGPSPAP
ncbi:Uncharacterised protein [Mycobacteroides abscessus]|uniref:Uncharacterized protein n=2 Tax=Mycobacteroides abscessus TaxID=36809 RepID=A0A0U0ZRD3_9MYCO|nr:Uncharacterised protein [Mycobacteroides abscessus]